jgi:TM2 domain-containing membrane protein YozV
MKSGFSANFQNCVTCAYWSGARSLNSTRTRAEYDAGVLGDCLYGGRRITHKPPTSRCSNYEKWPQLKSLGTSTSKSNNSTNKKGVIPYPVFVGLILLVGLIAFIKEHKEIFIPIGIGILFFSIIFVIAYAKGKKKRILMENQNIQTEPTSIIEDTAEDSVVKDNIIEQTLLDVKNGNPLPNENINKSQKEWLTTLLLLIFLGPLGVHRFYVGKIGTGILMILVSFCTLGIGAIIWYIIDLIFICRGKFKDKKGLYIIK